MLIKTNLSILSNVSDSVERKQVKNGNLLNTFKKNNTKTSFNNTVFKGHFQRVLKWFLKVFQLKNYNPQLGWIKVVQQFEMTFYT